VRVATNEIPTEYNAEALTHFCNERSRFDILVGSLETSRRTSIARGREISDSYYEILKDYAFMNRFSLEQCRLRADAINEMLLDERLNKAHA